MIAKNQELQHIESNARVCHGKWVFRGTRIFVSDVLNQLDAGMPRDVIVREWRGDVSLEAIEEAVRYGQTVIKRSKPAA